MAETSYSSIRRRHLVRSLRSLSRRQQTAILVVAAFLGPYTLAFMHGLVSGLDTFVAAGTSPEWRACAWLAWFLATGLVVLALREPVFMLAARPFVRMLPVSRAAHLACDVRSIAIAYSFLWLPIGYFAWRTWSLPGGLQAKLDATLYVGAGLSIAMALQALALQPRASAAALGLFGAGALCLAPSAPWPASWLVVLAALALSAFALATAYERPLRSRATAAFAPSFASRLAAASGLAVPVAWRDLRHALGLRLAWLAVLVAGVAWAARDGAFCGRRTGLHVMTAALAALAVYRVPALLDERLRESLPWLFRLERARRRAIASASVFTLAIFLAPTAAASTLWSVECGPFAAQTIVTVFSAALAALAAAAFRWKEASSWVAIVSLLALAFVMGEVL